jgi:hypothetical protein
MTEPVVHAAWIEAVGEELARRRARMIADSDWVDAARQLGAAIAGYQDRHEGHTDPASFDALLDAAEGEVERAHLMSLHNRLVGSTT